MVEPDVVTIEGLAERSEAMRRDRSWLRPLGGLVILGVLVWRVGAGAVADALRALDPGSVAVAVVAGAAIGVVTTVGAAGRWVLVARGLGADLTLRAAVAACYRSQLLNVTLPGGVLGDVHRGVRHGRAGGDVGRGLRSVVWERVAGQVVLAVLTVGALVLAPSTVTSSLSSSLAPGGPPSTTGLVVGALVLGGVGVGVVLVVVGARRRSRGRSAVSAARLLRTAMADVRAGLLGRHTWPGVVGASTLVVAGHVLTFVLAARAAGVSAPPGLLVPLALVALVGMAVPLNVAGWGPREGVTAWAFGAVGLGAAAGVGTAVVYGLTAFVAALPGAVLLVATRRGSAPPDPLTTPVPPTTVVLATEGGARG